MNRVDTTKLKNAISAITILIGLAVSNNVYAEWSGFAKITGFNVYNEVFYVQLQPHRVTNVSGCPNF